MQLARESQAEAVLLMDQVEALSTTWVTADQLQVGDVVPDGRIDAVRYSPSGNTVWLTVDGHEHSGIHVTSRQTADRHGLLTDIHTWLGPMAPRSAHQAPDGRRTAESLARWFHSVAMRTTTRSRGVSLQGTGHQESSDAVLVVSEDSFKYW